MVALRSQETSLARRISDLAQVVAQSPADRGQGLIEQYANLLELFFEEVCAAVKRHPSKVELLDTMEELRRKFRLWHDGEHQLDQRLVRASRIRKLLIFRLTVLTLDLVPGKTTL